MGKFNCGKWYILSLLDTGVVSVLVALTLIFFIKGVVFVSIPLALAGSYWLIKYIYLNRERRIFEKEFGFYPTLWGDPERDTGLGINAPLLQRIREVFRKKAEIVGAAAIEQHKAQVQAIVEGLSGTELARRLQPYDMKIRTAKREWQRLENLVGDHIIGICCRHECNFDICGLCWRDLNLTHWSAEEPYRSFRQAAQVPSKSSRTTTRAPRSRIRRPHL